MAIESKINRDGVDVVIEALQKTTFPRLLGFWDVTTTYISYPRANKVYRGDNIIPEVSLDKKDYREVLNDDKVFITSFFVADDSRLYNEETRQFKHRISMIFQADLVKLYGNSNRADEEFNMDVIRVLKKENVYIVGDITMVEGVDNVYSDLSITGDLKDNLKLTDMSQFHLLRVTFDVLYRDDCIKPIIKSCEGVSVSIDGVFSEVVDSGGVYDCLTGGLPADVTMDGNALVPVNGGNNKVMTIVDQASNPVTVTTNTDTELVYEGEITIPAAISTSPVTTGQETQSVAGDDGARFLSGEYAASDIADLSDTYTLVLDNEWGHKFRITGRTGGYQDPSSGGFFDKDGLPTTEALAWPNDIIRDYAYRDEWYRFRSGTRNFTDAVALAQTDSRGGETGWSLPNDAQYHRISSVNLLQPSFIDSRIFNWSAFNMWSSTTNPRNTLQAFKYEPSNNRSTSSVKTQTNGGAYVKPF